MTLFTSTLNQMLLLFSLIGIGFLLSRASIVPKGTAAILSKLENFVFLPAMVVGTFARNFTISAFRDYSELLLVGLLFSVLPIPLCIWISKLCSKDDFVRKLYTYGLVFSNFGFMGNAVVQALFPEQFVYYLVFTLPMYVVIYLWGVPALLIPAEGDKGIGRALRSLCNPLLIGSLVGMVIGITGLRLPIFVDRTLAAAEGCMSPVAMILTGITVAEMPFLKIAKMKGIYAVTALRLLVFPLVFGYLLKICGLEGVLYQCAVCALAMPLGLNTVVVPAGYGKDTSVAAGMALVSHVLSVLTIPLIFRLLL